MLRLNSRSLVAVITPPKPQLHVPHKLDTCGKSTIRDFGKPHLNLKTSREPPNI